MFYVLRSPAENRACHKGKSVGKCKNLVFQRYPAAVLSRDRSRFRPGAAAPARSYRACSARSQLSFRVHGVARPHGPSAIDPPPDRNAS